MSKLSVEQFLALVERSQLVAAGILAQTIKDWRALAPEADLDDVHACADHLVTEGLLTRWQSKKLLDGRHRGFLLGRYRLLDHLGSGGMSSVYLAEHVLMARLVAIKVLPQNRVNDGAYLARFHLEGQCAAALDHRNIVRAYDLANEGKIHYLVMEYVEGRDLEDLVRHDGPLDVHTAADYMAQAADGLEHAHQAGLIHRDIKPANLLVDLGGTVKILDMGLAKYSAAKATDASLNSSEHVLGTADYVAPEQAVNSSLVDPRADIYSLGCTLYFLLTGHPPFDFGSPLERMNAHQHQPPASILDDRPDAPDPLVAICQRMMQKSPERRFQSAAEVQRALTGWLRSEAEAGRIRPSQIGVVRRGSFGRVTSSSGSGSRINLITGSNPELERPTASASGLAGRQVTTEGVSGSQSEGSVAPKTSAADPKVTTASQSDVLHPAPRDGASPPPPPVVAPPPTRLAMPPPPLANGPFGTTEPAAHAIPVTPNIPLVRAATPLVPASARAAGDTRWAWILALSVLILGAALLALWAARG